MKMRQIGIHLGQVHKFREVLEDHYSPIDEIKRPKHTRPYLFKRRIEKLRFHEQEAARLYEEGILKWFDSAARKAAQERKKED